MKLITSPSNPIFKELKKLLNSKKQRQKTKSFVVEGKKAITALLENNSQYQVQKLFSLKDSKDNLFDCFPLNPNVQLYQMPKELFAKVSNLVTISQMMAVVSYVEVKLKELKRKKHYI